MKNAKRVVEPRHIYPFRIDHCSFCIATQCGFDRSYTCGVLSSPWCAAGLCAAAEFGLVAGFAVVGFAAVPFAGVVFAVEGLAADVFGVAAAAGFVCGAAMCEVLPVLWTE